MDIETPVVAGAASVDLLCRLIDSSGNSSDWLPLIKEEVGHLEARRPTGHNYSGHSYAGHNYIGHTYI